VLGQVDRAIALAPDNVSAYFAKSMYLNGSQRANEGLRAAAEGLAINPNYAPLYNARGYAEIGLGRFEQAESDIVRAMRLSPRDPTTGLWRTNLADAELGLGHFDAAIGLIHQAIDAGYRSGYPYRELAAAYALDGEADDAKTALAEALRFSPKLTVKSVARTNPLPVALEGLRKAGLPEE
jgi:tetratricopeptide (TPR) repeat protein